MADKRHSYMQPGAKFPGAFQVIREQLPRFFEEPHTEAMRNVADVLVPQSPSDVLLELAAGPVGKAKRLAALAGAAATYSPESDAGSTKLGGLAQAAKDPSQYIRGAWQAMRYGPTKDASEHARLYHDNARILARELGNVADGSEYDTAKNYLGGYDWGYRLHENPNTAADMARSYQLIDYLKGMFDPAQQQDAEFDYLENVDGVFAGAAARQRGEMFDADLLRELAKRYAQENKRQP
jgi:hypothetical protein